MAFDLLRPLSGDRLEAFEIFKDRVGSKLVELERLTASQRGRLVDCSDDEYASKSLYKWAEWVDETARLHPDPQMWPTYRQHLCEIFYDHCRPVLARKHGFFKRRWNDEKKLAPIVKLEKNYATSGQTSRLSASALRAQSGATAAARGEFAYFLVDNRPEVDNPKARLTINFDSHLAPRAIEAVGTLYRNPAFQGAKILSPSRQGKAGDNALMYLAEPVKDLRALDTLLAGFPQLRTDRFVPPGTLPTRKPGVGYSEFPDGTSTSHMASRVPVILSALRMRQADLEHPERPLELYVDEALRRNGFDVARPWARAAAPAMHEQPVAA